ncbi:MULTISPECIES: SDR family oxidoreductase [unclassified Pseudomonas]|uniref:SDR family NAD(P)-dependent oxidoreductase n=1 Tax=unclassified Pseudomonas TaxID=196821 RepID=UPI001C44A576|nr:MULTISPECIES: SDR family NAD(P)-dependent oxidoreductase [unclassified Pseudomonas]
MARRLERLEELAVQLRNDYGRTVQVVTADLANEQDVSQVEALVGSATDLRVLVNCAGLGALGMTTSIDPAMVDNMLKVNVVALTRLSLAAARRFAPAKEGTIINIGSVVAFMPVPGAGGYSGSKPMFSTSPGHSRQNSLRAMSQFRW